MYRISGIGRRIEKSHLTINNKRLTINKGIDPTLSNTNWTKRESTLKTEGFVLFFIFLLTTLNRQLQSNYNLNQIGLKSSAI